MRELIRRHGYRRTDFSPSDGMETVSAPADLHPRYCEHGFVEPGLVPGTPLHWRCTSVECDEWDCELPSYLLNALDLAARTDWAAEAAKFELAEGEG